MSPGVAAHPAGMLGQDDGRGSDPGAAFRKTAALNASLAVIYLLAGRLGLSLASVNPSATAVWPPTGIALAALVIFGRRVWPGIFAGAFLVNLLTAGSVATSLAIAAGNTFEGLLGSFLVMTYANGRRAFERPRDIFRFAALAAIVSTMVSATIGACSLVLAGLAPLGRAVAIWATWWLGDAAGDLVVAPLLILWSAVPLRWDRRRAPEAALLGLSLVVVGHMVFGGGLLGVRHHGPLDFLCIPLLIWTAFRFGQRETATVHFLLSVMAVWGTALGRGPFASDGANESLLVLQSFLAVTSVMGLTLSALVSEHLTAERTLLDLNGNLEMRVEMRTEAVTKANAALRREIAARQHSEEDLARANAELNLFASVASHELQEPLRKLVMFGELLQPNHAAPDAERAFYVDRMRDAAKRMQRLVSSLLELSRVATNAHPLEPNDVGAIVRDAAADFEPRVRETGGRLEIGPMPLLRSDPLQLRQVFENLFSNACKFTRDGQPVVIRVWCGPPKDGFVEITVQDNGIGFDEQYAERIFKPFQRLHRRSEYEGSGIGLAICSRILLRHGGAIAARSRLGEGSSFVITLPA